MASEQPRRGTTTKERVTVVEKSRVPKQSTQFESLSEDTKNSDVHHQKEIREGISAANEARNANLVSDKEAEKRKGALEKPEGKSDQETKGISLDEISKHRQTAQQNSIDAIRGAEERYQKEREASQKGSTKGSAVEGGKRAGEATKQGMQRGSDKAEEIKNSAIEKGSQAYQASKDTIVPAAQRAKDSTVEKGQSAAKFAGEKAAEVKDSTVEGGKRAAGATKQGMQRGAEYVSEKARDVKDAVVPKTQQAKDLTVEKAAGAKDATVEGGKQAAGFVGKVAGNVKDTAKVAGFGAAHFTFEKTAQATKGVTDVAANVAGYAGEKAVQAKDAVASGAQNVAHFAGDKITAARDAVVSGQESAAEYAARKKAEAQNEAEAKKYENKMQGEGTHGHRQGMQQQRGGQVQQDVKGSIPSFGEAAQQTGDMLGGVSETMGRPAQNAQKQIYGQQEQEDKAGGGVLHAIGETIAEIGQTTKELLVGQGQPARYREESNEK